MRLEVGRVGRAHGLTGEVAVVPITNRPERFAPGSTLFVGDRRVVIASARPHGARWLVRFEGIDDRAGAERLRNQLLTAEPLGEAPAGEMWVHELIGSDVRDRAGTALGRVVAVEANPAHDLLVLDNDVLIPVVFVVSHERDVVVVDVPAGLLDL